MLGRGRSYIWFLAAAAAIVSGFWPTFYGDPYSNDAWHTAHGIASSLWVVLLVAQSLLIRRDNRRWHERLGWASLALFAVLVVTMTYMVDVELVGDPDFPRALRLKLVFLDVALLLLFVVLYGLGLVYRRRPRLHARLLGSTMLIGLGPALGRLYAEHIPGIGLAGALPWTMWSIDAVLVAAILLERYRRRATWPFPMVLAAFLATQLGMDWATGPSFARMAKAAGAPI